MIDHLDYALEAVRARREGSYLYGEFLRELEAAGLSSDEIKALLEKAESMEPHPESPRALRILRAAAKAARRGDGDRTERLYNAARELLREDHEFFALIEEHRLGFCVRMPPAEPDREVRHGFALA